MRNSPDIKKIIKLCEIAVIVLLCIMFITAVPASPFYVFGNKTSDSVSVASRLGSRGSEVRQVQQALKDKGFYKGSVDGIFGTQTQSAVKAYQKSVGITADGIVGAVTLKNLGLQGSATAGSSAFSSNDVYLLAKLISAEARGESYRGQVAVAAVVLNRVEHASFPDSISGVIYQAGAFTAVRDHNWRQEPTAQSKKAAQDAINGHDPTGGAIFYYNPNTAKDQWIRTRPIIVQIGRHVFCR